MNGDEDVKDVKGWLNELTTEVYGEGIQKLVRGYDKCLNGGDDCVKKITWGSVILTH